MVFLSGAEVTAGLIIHSSAANAQLNQKTPETQQLKIYRLVEFERPSTRASLLLGQVAPPETETPIQDSPLAEDAFDDGSGLDLGITMSEKLTRLAFCKLDPHV